jgi:hypothetical protein
MENALVNLNEEGKSLEILFKKPSSGSHYATWINNSVSLLFDHKSLDLVGVEIDFSDSDYQSVLNALKGDLNISNDLLHKLMHQAMMTSSSLNEVVVKILEDRFAPSEVDHDKKQDEECNVCKGSGYMQIPNGRQCDQCGGSGKFVNPTWTLPTEDERRILISENIKKNKQLAEAVRKSREEFLAGKFNPSYHSMNKPCSPRPTKNSQAGKVWSKEEEKQLAKEFYDDRLLFREIAEIHGRTEGAIKSHLVKLGYMSWNKEKCDYVVNEYFDDFTDEDNK